MDIFINECSLHEQFVEQADFEIALRDFFQVLNTVLNKTLDYKLHQRGDLLYVYKAVRSTELVASLNRLRDKSFKIAINNVLYNKLNAQDWTQEQVHSSNDVFLCDGERVTDTCMAELAERLQSKIIEGGLLINFPQSKFLDLNSVTVEKNENIATELDCTDNNSSLLNWLETHFQISRLEYDVNSTDPPLDSQTILRDKRRFQRTGLPRQDGRALYREEETGFIWYVDNKHYGSDAHLEVFDRNGNYIGRADIEGNLSRLDKPDRRIAI